MSKAEQTRAKVFAIVTVAAGVIAIVLIVWRITKAWRIEYGGEPREPPGIPSGGSFGPPGGFGAPTATVTPTTPAATAAPTASP
jgi:hypothetical protein